MMLFCASYDCNMLCKDQTPLEVQAYNIWFMATEHDFDGDCARELEIRYPGIREASREEQRRIGWQLLEDTISGKFE